MRDLTSPEIHRYRVKYNTPDPRSEGAFYIPRETGDLRVIACAGGGWDHVSVSLDGRIPIWEEMDFIARMFFKEDETAVQYHVPRSDHVNCNPYTLHLWRPLSKLRKVPRPPAWMV